MVTSMQLKKRKIMTRQQQVQFSRLPETVVQNVDATEFDVANLKETINPADVAAFLARFKLAAATITGMITKQKLTPIFLYTPPIPTREDHNAHDNLVVECICVFTKASQRDLYIIRGIELSFDGLPGRIATAFVVGSITEVQKRILDREIGYQTYGASLLKCLNSLAPEQTLQPPLEGPAC